MNSLDFGIANNTVIGVAIKNPALRFSVLETLENCGLRRRLCLGDPSVVSLAPAVRTDIEFVITDWSRNEIITCGKTVSGFGQNPKLVCIDTEVHRELFDQHVRVFLTSPLTSCSLLYGLLAASEGTYVFETKIDPFLMNELLKGKNTIPTFTIAETRQRISNTVRITERESEVLNRIIAGSSNKEIAEDMCLSLETVKSHVHSLLTKYNLRSRTQLAVEHLKGVEVRV